eukprot:518449-Amphidinium_carterae.1
MPYNALGADTAKQMAIQETQRICAVVLRLPTRTRDSVRRSGRSGRAVPSKEEANLLARTQEHSHKIISKKTASGSAFGSPKLNL